MGTMPKAEDFKDTHLPHLLGSAHHELEMERRGYAAQAFGFVRVLGDRIRREWFEDSGEPRVRAPFEERLLAQAIDKAMPGQRSEQEQALLVAQVRNDLIALKDYRGRKTFAAPEKIDGLMDFMTAYYDILEREHRADPSRTHGR